MDYEALRFLLGGFVGVLLAFILTKILERIFDL